MLKIHLKTVHDMSNIIKIYFFSVKSLMGKPVDWKFFKSKKLFRGILVLGQTRAQRQVILLLCQTRAQRHHFFWPPFFLFQFFLGSFFYTHLFFFNLMEIKKLKRFNLTLWILLKKSRWSLKMNNFYRKLLK